MKKGLSTILVMILLASMFAGCGSTSSSDSTSSPESKTTSSSVESSTPQSDASQDTPAEERHQLQLWYWSPPPQHQELMNRVLIDKLNNSQDRFQINIEYKAGNAQAIATALAANSGPDIVSASGPATLLNYASNGRLENLDSYAEKYGWKERVIEPIYQLTMYNGSQYGISTSLLTEGVFYNKKVLADNGWEVPQTVEDIEKIMDEAMAKGMYASVTGAKGWRPTNAVYVSLFLNHFAGPEIIKKCLAGEEKWNNPLMVEAINKSSEWYQKGYLAGDNYFDLDFQESVQLLAMEQSPFFIGPTNVFQWAPEYFDGDNAENLGFCAFPATNDRVGYPNYMLGVPYNFGINAFSQYKDDCAEVLDFILSNDFMVDMANDWPGYWAVPIKDANIPEGIVTAPISKLFVDVSNEMRAAIENNNYGYQSTCYFPPATETTFFDIDSVWQKQITTEQLLNKVDEEFAKELEAGFVSSIE